MALDSCGGLDEAAATPPQRPGRRGGEGRGTEKLGSGLTGVQRRPSAAVAATVAAAAAGLTARATSRCAERPDWVPAIRQVLLVGGSGWNPEIGPWGSPWKARARNRRGAGGKAARARTIRWAALGGDGRVDVVMRLNAGIGGGKGNPLAARDYVQAGPVGRKKGIYFFGLPQDVVWFRYAWYLGCCAADSLQVFFFSLQNDGRAVV